MKQPKAKKQTNLHLTTPLVQTMYLGQGLKQEAKYLQLSGKFGMSILKEDVKNGAKPYAPFLETLKQNETCYNIITVPTEEDGFRAVAYLAGIYAEENEPLDEEIIPEYEDEKQDDVFGDIFDFDSDPSIGNSIDDLFNEDGFGLEDDAPQFPESSDRIPVISMSAVTNYDRGPASLPFGSFNLQSNNATPFEAPWWTSCTEGSVCIIKSPEGFMDPFDSYESLSEMDIHALKRFSCNERVYIVIVGDKEHDYDYSINTCMLEYTANQFAMDDKPEVMDAYYLKLLTQSAKEHGFKFSRHLDLSMMCSKLSKIDKMHPCAKFDKIMQYLLHIKAPQELTAKEFESLGLSKMIAKIDVNKSNATLDKDLVGMQQVKNQVNATLNLLRYNQKREKMGIKGAKFHNVHLFIGAPGTAKTTVAQIMANTMATEGLLSGNRFISVTGAQLKGAYVGQTAPKVHSLFMEYDAILIDEAYSLTSSMNGEMDSYSQEALAQLAVELEQHATDKLVIFAGYGGRNVSKENNLMYQFLQANPGIKSRVCSTIYFDSYSPDDMLAILQHLSKQADLVITNSCDEQIKAYFAKRQYQNDFGNGREARVFLELCQRNLAQRIMSGAIKEPSKKDMNTVTEADVTATLNELTNSRTEQLGQHSTSLGFI